MGEKTRGQVFGYTAGAREQCMPKIDIAAVPARKGSGYPPRSTCPVLHGRDAAWARRASFAISVSI
jgi:hypothetical protein